MEKEMEEIYTFTKSNEKDFYIHVRLVNIPTKSTSTHELSVNLIKYIDFDCARYFSPGTYDPHVFEHNIELSLKDIEIMLSNSHKARIEELEKEMKKVKKLQKNILYQIKNQCNMYYIERKKRGIPLQRDRLRDEINALERVLENKKKELNGW
jgi:hypothetical protein